MPGPCAKDRSSKQPAQNSPNKKTKARLQKRIDAFRVSSPGEVQAGLMYHLPGSENRKK